MFFLGNFIEKNKCTLFGCDEEQSNINELKGKFYLQNISRIFKHLETVFFRL